MNDDLISLKEFLEEISKKLSSIFTIKDLEEYKLKIFGKKGLITSLLKKIPFIEDKEKRKEYGLKLNKTKLEAANIFKSKEDFLIKSDLHYKLEKETIDITLSTRPSNLGKIHIISHVIETITKYFCSIGFSIAFSSEIEDENHNFTMLNIPYHHPARQLHDTFYLSNGFLLRTHTTPIQVHLLKIVKPPFRILTYGKAYRYDYDSTHTPMFHQLEGIVLDKSSNISNLKGTITDFLNYFFNEKKIEIRFRPSYFPFTEPSAEVDIKFLHNRKEKDSNKKSNSFLEVLGCGMIHPNILKIGNINKDEFQGFAFGIGVERLAMLKYEIPDIRSFYNNDMRWLSHYGLHPLSSIRER